MKTLACLSVLGFVALSHAAAPDKLSESAGPQPTEAAARSAVLAELRRTTQDTADLSRVRFMSGPHLATGTNFANGREQAWAMCVVTGNARMSHGPLELDVKAFLLRTRDGVLRTVSPSNWQDSDINC